MSDTPKVTALEENVWVYLKPGPPPVYRVHPSPKAVKKLKSLTFINLTDKEVKVKGKSSSNVQILDPDELTIPAWTDRAAAPPSKTAAATENLGAHQYKIQVGGNDWAQGGSDPDIIIDP